MLCLEWEAGAENRGRLIEEQGTVNGENPVPDQCSDCSGIAVLWGPFEGGEGSGTVWFTQRARVGL